MNNKIKNIKPVIYHQSDLGLIKFNPYWISGFVAGEGCFLINSKKGIEFHLCLTTSDQHILWAIWTYFGKHGKVRKTHNNTATLKITNKEGIRVLINFFDKYPILGNKCLDYAAFREIAILKERNQHNTKEGYKRCVELYVNQNTGRNYYNSSQRAKIIKKYAEILDYNGQKLSIEAKQSKAKQSKAKKKK